MASTRRLVSMTAVTERFGASSKAFVVTPLLGTFFIGISNALIIQFFMAQIQ